jgi:predicted metal-dependent phosphoesterase TrpH
VVVGRAILHLHTTFSDGTATVEEILDDVEQRGEIDVVGVTDHDDTRAFARALRWKAEHPDSQVWPIWGVELTIRAFKHLLLFRLEPPFPVAPPPKFLSLRAAIAAARSLDAVVVVPHVDTFWIGLGRQRLADPSVARGIDGFELLNPYHGSAANVAALLDLNWRIGRHTGRPLLAIGGSDAHHLEDLYRVVVEFPGHTPADLARAFRDQTALPRWGPISPPPSRRKQLRQHSRALLFHPAEQVRHRLRRLLGQSDGPGTSRRSDEPGDCLGSPVGGQPAISRSRASFAPTASQARDRP